MAVLAGWCIVSSPLILAFNISEPARRELVWPIITNKEAIMINQIWAGHPGSQVRAGTQYLFFDDLTFFHNSQANPSLYHLFS